MAILKVLTYGDPLLRGEAEEVHKISAKVQKLVDDLFDTMYAYNGCGLAATQVGVMKRVFVLDCSTDEQPMPRMVFINPTIVKRTGAIVSREGCLSFPEVFIEVKRYQSITLRFKDLKGRSQQMEVADGSLLCRAIQHEMDHLNGVLFVDHGMEPDTIDSLLAEQNLPCSEPDKRIVEPELDALLRQQTTAMPL
jgi:peptide deformylase